MAWTTPRTWTDGELVTAAIMNAHVRDNMNALTRFVGKTADEAVTSSVTLQNDDHLFFAMGANETYFFSGVLWYENAGTVGDLQITFTVPAAGDYHALVEYWNTSIASFTLSDIRSSAGTAAIGAGSTGNVARFCGVVQNAGTAGNFQLQWAQNTSDGSGTVMKKGSAMWFQKVA